MITTSLLLYAETLTIFHLAEINIRVQSSDGTTLIHHEHDQLPDFILEDQQRDFSSLNRQALLSEKACYLYTNNWGLSYLVSIIQADSAEPAQLILGPFLMNIPSMSAIDARFHLDQTAHMIVQKCFRGLKLVSNSKLQSLVNVVDKASTLQPVPYQILSVPDETLKPSFPNSHNGNDAPPYHSDKKHVEIIESIYRVEKSFMHAIEIGDKPGLLKIMREWKSLFDFSERFPNQPVRALRNMLIVMNTLMRSAAEKGKVHPYFLHHMSEMFSKQIERSESINSLLALMDLMCDEYCELVNRHTAAGYPPLIQQAIQQLQITYSEPLKLSELANACMVHPAHLSRQFKKQTGMTLTDYQHKLRIEEAKRLLRKDRTPIDWIAGQVGFEDASYFTRIFKRLEGVSPSRYRADNG